jgi:hypothetical protein
MMSFHKVYLSNCFDKTTLSVPHEEIETYMQILFLAFQFSLLMQNNKSSIGDIIPILTNVFKMKQKLKSIQILNSAYF